MLKKQTRQLESGGYTRTIVENINVPGWNFDVSTDGDYKSIKIGSADKFVEGDQQFVITYRILNAINFFKDHSEFYFNVIGNQWETTIASVNFSIELYQCSSGYFGLFCCNRFLGPRENKTITKWEDNNIFSGHTHEPLKPNEGLTVGIGFPKDFLIKPDYRFLRIYWMLLAFPCFCRNVLYLEEMGPG